LAEQFRVNITRTMQYANDLDRVGRNPIEDQIGWFNQQPRVRCDIRPDDAGFRKRLQNFEPRLDPVVNPIGCGDVVLGDGLPQIQQIAPRAGGEVKTQFLSRGRVVLAARCRLQFSEIQRATVTTGDTLSPSPPQIVHLLGLMPVQPLKQS
jgi:hypothetical protein